MVAVWRRELVHLSKARDSHLSLLGAHLDTTLLVRDTASIGPHVASAGTRVERLRSGQGASGAARFFVNALRWLRAAGPIEILLLPLGHEWLAPLARLALGRRPFIVVDLWDVPDAAVFERNVFRWLSRRLFGLALPVLLRAADMVIAGVVPEGLAHLRVPRSRMLESENGVDLKLFDASVGPSDLWDNVGGEVRLLYVGYVHPARGAVDLIEAMRLLRAGDMDVSLLLVGPGPADVCETLKRRIGECDVAAHVDVVGDIPSSEIPSVIAGATICLCPLQDIRHFRWSYPVKIYEYMAMGKPIVASDLPGTRRLIRDGRNGVLHQPGDVASLVEAIGRIVALEDRGASMGAAGRMGVAGKDWPNVVARIAEAIVLRLHGHRPCSGSAASSSQGAAPVGGDTPRP